MTRPSLIAKWKEAPGAAVLFDFGGTLDADGVTWKERVFRLCRDAGVVTAPDRFDPAFYAADDRLSDAVPPTLSFHDTVLRLVAGVTEALGLCDPALTERIADRFLEDALGRLRHNVPLLRSLSRRYRLGVVSNFYGNLATVCEDAGIRPFLTVLVDSGRVGYRKPDPRIFYQATGELEIDPSHALFVGDSLPRDMAGARAVGMPHIWLTATPGGGKACCPDDGVIHSLGELEGLLL